MCKLKRDITRHFASEAWCRGIWVVRVCVCVCVCGGGGINSSTLKKGSSMELILFMSVFVYATRVRVCVCTYVTLCFVVSVCPAPLAHLVQQVCLCQCLDVQRTHTSVKTYRVHMLSR